ncbi:MAG: hypothetical protein IPN13_07715 [Bacteroidetes bacterium]|nr:hypothetical protein [Bacteroidota bacterium]
MQTHFFYSGTPITKSSNHQITKPCAVTSFDSGTPIIKPPNFQIIKPCAITSFYSGTPIIKPPNHQIIKPCAVQSHICYSGTKNQHTSTSKNQHIKLISS